MRLSIDITKEQHQYLKAAAALQGQSIKEFVLKRTLPNINEQAALEILESFLEPRLANAKNGNISTHSVDSIFDQMLNEDANK